MTLKWNGVIQRKLALLDQQVVFAECRALPLHGPHAQPDRSWL